LNETMHSVGDSTPTECIVESILDLTALWHPPPVEAGDLGRVSSVLNKFLEAKSKFFLLVTRR
jgi:hypothetical protein